MSLVPVLLGDDSDSPAYQAAPRLMIEGTAVRVSTLLIVVGIPNRPATAGNGGLMRGLPRLPSIAFINAVSSPQMYAPAPRCTMMSIRLPEPNTFSPSAPAAYASATACSRIR